MKDSHIHNKVTLKAVKEMEMDPQCCDDDDDDDDGDTEATRLENHERNQAQQAAASTHQTNACEGDI